MSAQRPLPLITTARLVLRLAEVGEAGLVARYYQENREHLADSGPRYAADFFQESYWEKQLETNIDEYRNDQSLKLFIFEKTGDGLTDSIVGSVNFNNIVRRAAQFCYLGYGLAGKCQGLGYMTEALQAAIPYAFNELNLHRVMANYQPHNRKSGNVLKRLGFVPEGYARDYLFINGQWQDHVLTSLTNTNWRDEGA